MLDLDYMAGLVLRYLPLNFGMAVVSFAGALVLAAIPAVSRVRRGPVRLDESPSALDPEWVGEALGLLRGGRRTVPEDGDRHPRNAVRLRDSARNPKASPRMGHAGVVRRSAGCRAAWRQRWAARRPAEDRQFTQQFQC